MGFFDSGNFIVAFWLKAPRNYFYCGKFNWQFFCGPGVMLPFPPENLPLAKMLTNMFSNDICHNWSFQPDSWLQVRILWILFCKSFLLSKFWSKIDLWRFNFLAHLNLNMSIRTRGSRLLKLKPILKDNFEMWESSHHERILYYSKFYFLCWANNVQSLVHSKHFSFHPQLSLLYHITSDRTHFLTLLGKRDLTAFFTGRALGEE